MNTWRNKVTNPDLLERQLARLLSTGSAERSLLYTLLDLVKETGELIEMEHTLEEVRPLLLTMVEGLLPDPLDEPYRSGFVEVVLLFYQMTAQQRPDFCDRNLPGGEVKSGQTSAISLCTSLCPPNFTGKWYDETSAFVTVSIYFL